MHCARGVMIRPEELTIPLCDARSSDERLPLDNNPRVELCRLPLLAVETCGGKGHLGDIDGDMGALVDVGGDPANRGERSTLEDNPGDNERAAGDGPGDAGRFGDTWGVRNFLHESSRDSGALEAGDPGKAKERAPEVTWGLDCCLHGRELRLPSPPKLASEGDSEDLITLGGGRPAPTRLVSPTTVPRSDNVGS